MPLDCLAVTVGESAPGHEPHDAGLVENENGSALATQSPDDGFERSIIDIVPRVGPEQPIGELVQCRLLVGALRQHRLHVLAMGDVAGNLRRTYNGTEVVCDR